MIKLFIKNMVCKHCYIMVIDQLEILGLHIKSIELGEVEIIEFITVEMHSQLRILLHNVGFELIENKNIVLIEKIKNAVIEMVHYSDDMNKINFSDYLSKRLNHDYSYLSNRFSMVQGSTIEHFIIAQKIERIKELISYNELNMSEIANSLNYSSVSHLSKQFKNVTGLTPSVFKRLNISGRYPIEDV